MSDERKKILNFGCGYDLHDDAVNVDQNASLNDWYFADHYEEIRLYHVIEHFQDPLWYMGQLYEVAAPDCRLYVRCPYGSTDDAWENPTHVRPYFRNSFNIFGQQYWWREDTFYKADWRIEEMLLFIHPDIYVRHEDHLEELLRLVDTQRNVVGEMVVELRAQKPARQFEKGTRPEYEEWGPFPLRFAPGITRKEPYV